jgi:hypothetical protein
VPFLRRRQEDEHDFSAAVPPAPEVPLAPEASLVPEAPPAPEVQPDSVVASQFQLVEGADEMLDMPLGTLIFRAGLIAPQQLEDALAEGLRSGKRLGEVLLARGWLSEEDLSRLLAGQKGLPYADVEQIAIDRELAQAMSYEDARREMALPLVTEFGAPVVAVCDPDEGVMERLRARLGPETRFVIAAPSALARLTDEVLGGVAAPASTLLVTPSVPEQAQPEPLPAEPAPGETSPVEPLPAEAPLVFVEEPVAPPAQEEQAAREEFVPLITPGEIDYPNFDSYSDAPQPEILGAPLEQLPPDVQTGEYGYYGDSSLLEGSAWQPGEPAPEAAAPGAEEYAAYEQPPEGEPSAAESWQETPPQSVQEPVPEPAPSNGETPEQPVEEIAAADDVMEVGTVTPVWMQGEANVIADDAADFVESGVSQAPDSTARPGADWQPEGAGEELEPVAEEGDAWEPPLAPEGSAEEVVAETSDPAEAAAKPEPDPVAEPEAEAPAPAEAEPDDASRGEYELVLRLSDGDRVPIGTYPNLEEAQAQAGEIVKQFSDVKDGGWPFIGGRYLRPETIVSIDVERQDTGWSGSGARGRMFTGDGDA